MDKRPDFKSFKKEALKNAKVRAEYEVLRPEFELMIEISRAHRAAKLSQKYLVKKQKRQNIGLVQ